MQQLIQDIKSLEDRVGRVPGPRDIKVIPYLDSHAIRWIAASPLMFFSIGEVSSRHMDISVAGADKGFVRVHDPETISIPLQSIDHPEILQQGVGFGSLFLIPHLQETLRVNGMVQSLTEDWLTIRIQECYLHCAKALIRSAFWQGSPQSVELPAELDTFLQQAEFMALATVDQHNHADLSPKGDPKGQLLKRIQGMVCFADRPGNRRVDSFRNILEQPEVAALVLIVGTPYVLRIRARAEMAADPAWCAQFTVQNRVPHLVTALTTSLLQIEESPALQRARLWEQHDIPEDINSAEIFKAHVKLNKTGGVAARLTRAVVSVPGVMEKGLRNDYKNNLY